MFACYRSTANSYTLMLVAGGVIVHGACARLELRF
jgi:hypothetical protein